VSIVDVVQTVVEGGTRSLVALALVPCGLGLVAWLLARVGNRSASQLVANLGIALGLGSVLVTICALVWAAEHGTSPLADVPAVWWLVPIWLVAASLFVEHRLHPGRQEWVRAPIRRAMLVVIVLAVVYWLLSTMRVWMLVHTGILGLLVFLAVLVGLFYVLARRVI
jgi:hypothetical protein